MCVQSWMSFYTRGSRWYWEGDRDTSVCPAAKITLYIHCFLPFAPPEMSIFCFSVALGLMTGLQNNMRLFLVISTHTYYLCIAFSVALYCIQPFSLSNAHINHPVLRRIGNTMQYSLYLTWAVLFFSLHFSERLKCPFREASLQWTNMSEIFNMSWRLL